MTLIKIERCLGSHNATVSCFSSSSILRTSKEVQCTSSNLLHLLIHVAQGTFDLDQKIPALKKGIYAASSVHFVLCASKVFLFVFLYVQFSLYFLYNL